MSTPSHEHPKDEFRRLRRALGLTQLALARTLGIDRQRVYARERGTTQVRNAELLLLRSMVRERENKA